ncbi:MAG: GTPase ObgE [Vicinamibacterales bacterium]|jgi:GTP-binding protein|nr:GTPase ObgE [Acidobacteriota bacterium]MDP7294985.1 GTPase ObgE [Vicinamibacterales bacterium]MDP7472012.1 GTPase ObgE [Vicinamibacterales bacterium]HJO39100.1 GTPase ObgE [Vicinamibacterales bacterium]|tara:strand:- start:543 stop:1598 length:1056 start_codon:yes stop_codon:yes gene_type:complete
MFVDEVDIHVTAGHGGRGCLSFRREKFIPRGGPDGGDGGRGGSIYVVASQHVNTLVHYRFHPEFRAKRGAHGEGANRSGRRGDDIELEVPTGTIVSELTEDGPVELADLTEAGQRVVVARGGLGGRGNAQFATSTNRAPRRTEPGLEGDDRQLQLKLKLLADVGLVGFPNVGKSTLIARISAARPKIANYPFTTLSPNLGVVSLSDDRSFVVADVPGLLGGAHSGHGLGHQFLSHLERTKVLVHLVDVSSASGRDPLDDYDTIRRELALYPVGAEDPAGPLDQRPQLVAANKIDALDEPARLERLRVALTARDVTVYPISAVTGEGLRPLLEAMWRVVSHAAPSGAAAAGE